jgi:hypothetical protein
MSIEYGQYEGPLADPYEVEELKSQIGELLSRIVDIERCVEDQRVEIAELRDNLFSWTEDQHDSPF